MEHGQLAYRTLYEELYASLIQIEENVNKKIQHRSRCIQGLGKRNAKSQRTDDGDQMADDGKAFGENFYNIEKLKRE